MSNNLSKIEKIVKKIESYDEEYSKLTDEELRGKTALFKERLANGETLDDILPEAFATCREAAWRVLKMKHFHVQLIGGVVLHKGMIAEMRTGEGKTLVATTAVYLNALTGKGVHVVTVNDYLAKRDKDQMGKIYNFLGLSVGCILSNMSPLKKKEAYACDITYGTNNEFGFDYLRDNMVGSVDRIIQRELNFAIIDEVDSILIDEARTPLIISSHGNGSMQMFSLVDSFVKTLERGPDPVELTKFDSLVQQMSGDETEEEGDFIVDEKRHSVYLTKAGVTKAEKFFRLTNLADERNSTLVGYINQSLKANNLMKIDKDYIVKDGKVIIVDDFTGRLQDGRRYSDGLHQAIEAKEGVEIQKSSSTQATITLQNYFRMYNKISGMTGTGKTEQKEFKDIYKLKVVTIPTNLPVQRIDENDKIYETRSGKLHAIYEKVKELNEIGQPVLIGTESVEKSEQISYYLSQYGIKHNVLNAKFHEEEAKIIAQAGRLNAVTIATNMAGRGTDILLGGNPDFMAQNKMSEMGYSSDMIVAASGFAHLDDEQMIAARELYQKLYSEFKVETDIEKEKVKELGGLYIIGTDRHESRRIDNQLRGRAGRQGDPGHSCFYLSLEDDLMRIFGGRELTKTEHRIGDNHSEECLEGKIFTNLVKSSQKKIELQHFKSRKDTVDYDDVNNIQRSAIYQLRREIVEKEDNNDIVNRMFDIVPSVIVNKCIKHNTATLEEIDELNKYLKEYTKTNVDIITRENHKKKIIEETLKALFNDIRQKKMTYMVENNLGEVNDFNKYVLLGVIDKYWMGYLNILNNLKEFTSIAGFGTYKPIELYKLEAYDMFNKLLSDIRLEVVKTYITVQFEKKSEPQKPTVYRNPGVSQLLPSDKPNRIIRVVNTPSEKNVVNITDDVVS